MNNIEIISFINFSIDNENERININIFDALKNLKEFFINNTNGIKIGKINDITFDKFKYIYKGYDIEDNLIYYRNGTNPIKSIDLLDLINLFNKKLVKIKFINENIDIIFNKKKTQLKIVNLNKDINNNYSISNLSDFIKNLNSITELIIERFDFTFEEMQNEHIKKLSINYDNNCEELFNYNINVFNKTIYFIQKDINLKKKFPLLEEFSIGNIKKELILFDQLLKTDNFFSDKINTINIISYQNFKS